MFWRHRTGRFFNKLLGLVEKQRAAINDHRRPFEPHSAIVALEMATAPKPSMATRFLHLRRSGVPPTRPQLPFAADSGRFTRNEAAPTRKRLIV